MTNEFMPPEVFAKGKAKKAEYQESKPWVHVGADGKVTRMERCWSDPDGCGRYVYAGDFDYEHHLCRQCCRGIEANWQVSQTMVGIVLACIRLDRATSQRIRAINRDPDFLRAWNATSTERVRWMLKRMGDKPWLAKPEEIQALSAQFFRAAMAKAGAVEPQGKGIQAVTA